MTLAPSHLFLTIITIVVIVFAIAIAALVPGQYEKPFSQIITVGPVWQSLNWTCTSDEDFIVHGVLRGYEGAYLSLAISGLGFQSLFAFDYERMEAFSIGADGGQTITMTRAGTVEGWVTLQTIVGAEASCIQT